MRLAERASARLLLRDPAIDAPIEHVEWHLSAAEDGVMEAANVELVAKSILRPLAQFLHLDHADLVAGRLSRHDDVTPHLGADLAFGCRRILDEIPDGLFLGP